MTHKIEINNNIFILHTSGAIYWPKHKALLIADVHLGKVSHFRKHGIGIPSVALHKNFDELDGVVSYFEAEKVWFLGDLFHSVQNIEWLRFEDWCKDCPTEIILIAGNHDIIQDWQYEEIGVKMVEEIIVDGFLLTHFPTEREGLFVFAGHIHPGIKIRGVGRQSENLACFFRTKHQIILPAFGEFTGKHILKAKVGDIAYAIAGDEIIEIERQQAVK